MELHTEQGLTEALQYIEQGNPVHARDILGALLENDLTSTELIFTARCCTFWTHAVERMEHIETPYERGESLLGEWKTYLSFIAPEKTPYEPALFAVQRGVFSRALAQYQLLFDDREPLQRADAYWRAGICYKKLGQFDNAKNCLSRANDIHRDFAPLIAELADCYCLCGEDRPGKLLFREAFFLEPERIDLNFLDSALIRRLIERTAEKGYSGPALHVWLPVYGVLWGIFNITRELRSQEVVKLKQDIYALENELKEPGCEDTVVMPRLINRYFWLIDYYSSTADNSKKINEVLLKIKILDSTIYDLYVQ
ncbi:MAG: hypothetical protein IJ191_04785 [Treponema sp.]|nr:hypothetical protein [Treponema sp.]